MNAWPAIPATKHPEGDVLAVCPDCTARDGQVRSVRTGTWTRLEIGLEITEKKRIDSRVTFDPCPWGPHFLIVEMLRERVIAIRTGPLKSFLSPTPLAPSPTVTEKARRARRGVPARIVVKPR